MDISVEGVRAVKTYIFEYVTGVLWVLATIATTTSRALTTAIVDAPLAFIKQLSDLHVPEFVLGGIVLVGGLSLPYAVAMALRPLSIGLINRVLSAYRYLAKHVFKRDVSRFSASASGIVEPAIRDSLIDHAQVLAYLATRTDHIAETLEAMRAEVVFRATATLPSAILFAALVYRIAKAHAGLWSIGVGLTLFALGAAHTIREFNRWDLRVSAAIVLESAKSAG